MITKNTVAFSLAALLVVGMQAENPESPKRGFFNNAARFAGRTTGRIAGSRPVVLLIGCATYPILQKTLFADSPLLDGKSLAAYFANKWENNAGRAKVNAVAAYNASLAKTQNTYNASKQWVASNWTKAQENYTKAQQKAHNSWATTLGYVHSVSNSQAMKKAMELAARTKAQAQNVYSKTFKTNRRGANKVWDMGDYTIIETPAKKTLDPEIAYQMTDGGASDWEL